MVSYLMYTLASFLSGMLQIYRGRKSHMLVLIFSYWYVFTFGLIQVEFVFLQWFASHIQHSSALFVFMISDVSQLSVGWWSVMECFSRLWNEVGGLL